MSAMRWLTITLLTISLTFLTLACSAIPGGDDDSGRAVPTGGAGDRSTRATGKENVVTNAELQRVANDPDRYGNAPIDVTGKITGTQKRGDRNVILIDTDPGSPAGDVQAEVPEGQAAPPVGSMVRVTGTISRFEARTWLDGTETNVPYVATELIELQRLPDGSTPSPTATVTPPVTPTSTPMATDTPAPPTATSTALPTDTPVPVTPTQLPSPTAAPTQAPSVVPTQAAAQTPTVGAAPTAPTVQSPTVAAPTTAPTGTAPAQSTGTSVPVVTPSVAATPSPQSASAAAGPPRFELALQENSARSVRVETEAMTHDPELTDGQEPGASGQGFVESTTTNQGWDGRGNPPKTGQASATIVVPEAGRYAVWVRMRYQHKDANSVWLRIDDDRTIRVGNEENGYEAWKWVGWQDGQTDRRIIVDLEPGEHQISLIGREKGTAIDAVIVTSDLEMTPRD